jgi:predicted small lipoprotein YifL
MNKVLASLLAAAFLFTLTVGCGETPKTTPAKDKDKPAEKDKKDK